MRTYERKKEFWISGKSACHYADVVLADIGDLEVHIKGAEIFVSNVRGVSYNGKPLVKAERKIEKGDKISFGNYQITFFEDCLEIEGDVPSGEMKLLEMKGEQGRFTDFPYYKRSPRVIYTTNKEEIQIKAPSAKKEASKGGILQMIIPTLSTAAITVVMGVVMQRGIYVFMSLGMTVVTTIFSVKNFLTERKETKQENQKRDEIYEEYLVHIRKQIKKARKKEKEALAYQNPAAATLEEMINGYSSRLYERSGMDEDFLQVNLGYYRGSSGIRVTYQVDEIETDKDILKERAKEIPKEYKTVDYLPLAIDLKKAHLGLVGSKKNIHEQLKYMLMQFTFFQSYRELQIVFIHNGAYCEDFAYVKWYPHLHIDTINVTGEVYNVQARDQIFGSIQQILKERKQKQEEEEQQEVVFSPYMLFIIDDPSLILNHPVMEYMQSKEHNLGFRFIYTTDQQENIPENVHTVCLLENTQEGRLLLNEGKRVNQRFAIQHVEDIQLEETARTLSAIVHVQGMSSQIPEAITFFEMFGIEHPEELHVQKRWEENQSHQSLAVPLGVRAKEDYVELNLHEKAHGPHGLVAGTTGSGKSEIVQSYILSLAVNFHPNEVGFLLIDYKGGGMANLFAKLPHLLGTITNLDKAESMRAMASIKSELARRQQIFGEHGVNHINGYNKLFKLGKVEEPLPHLFLISDEFAELKKEQPEFMSELVSAARIGRSLGIHLILATQKPSGVVDDQIWTNSKFKLCLKVQNEGDSKEMLKTPDAANITQAGRSYLQVGNNEIYELFQSAWSGATYQTEQSEEEKEDDRVYVVNEIGQGVLINKDLSGSKESNQIKATQLDVVVSHLHEVYHSRENVEVKKPWLPSLGAMLLSPYTQEVVDSAKFTKLDITLGLGMMDIPEEQEQREYMLDLLGNGHLLYMASSGYGKSMFLGNMIMGLAMKNAVKNLNIYILDLGNSALIPYSALPHVADYLSFDEAEKLAKFQRLIFDMIAERKKLLAQAMAQNFNVYNQSQEEKLRAIVIAVDNYDIVGELGDEMVSFLQKVSRDGAGLGIYLVVTLTRDSVMRAATKGNFKERIAGFNFVDGENTAFLGRSQIQLPEDKKGRALVKQEGIHLMQLYTPVSCEDELAYNGEVKALIEEVAQASTEERAAGIPVLPEVLHYEMLSQYPGYVDDKTLLPIGLDSDTLEVQYLDLKIEPGLIVGGAGVGKTNMVKTLVKHVKGARIYIFDNQEGVLRGCASGEGIFYAGAQDEARTLLKSIQRIVKARQERYEEAKIEKVSFTVKDFAREAKKIYIILDSLQQVYEMIGDDASMEVLAEATKYGFLSVATSEVRIQKTTSSAFINLFTSSTQGLVLGNIRDQMVFAHTGIRETNHMVDIGYYHNRGNNRRIKLIENL